MTIERRADVTLLVIDGADVFGVDSIADTAATDDAYRDAYAADLERAGMATNATSMDLVERAAKFIARLHEKRYTGAVPDES